LRKGIIETAAGREQNVQGEEKNSNPNVVSPSLVTRDVQWAGPTRLGLVGQHI